MDKIWIDILKTLMENAGDNEYSLADKAGISQPTINRILKGKHGEPKLSTLKKFADAYQIKISQLTGELPIDFGENGNVVEVFFVIHEERKILHRQADEIPEANINQAK